MASVSTGEEYSAFGNTRIFTHPKFGESTFGKYEYIYPYRKVEETEAVVKEGEGVEVKRLDDEEVKRLEDLEDSIDLEDLEDDDYVYFCYNVDEILSGVENTYGNDKMIVYTDLCEYMNKNLSVWKGGRISLLFRNILQEYYDESDCETIREYMVSFGWE